MVNIPSYVHTVFCLLFINARFACIICSTAFVIPKIGYLHRGPRNSKFGKPQTYLGNNNDVLEYDINIDILLWKYIIKNVHELKFTVLEHGNSSILFNYNKIMLLIGLYWMIDD